MKTIGLFVSFLTKVKVVEMTKNLLTFSRYRHLFSKNFQIVKLCEHVQSDRNFENMSQKIGRTFHKFSRKSCRN